MRRIDDTRWTLAVFSALFFLIGAVGKAYNLMPPGEWHGGYIDAWAFSVALLVAFCVSDLKDW